MFGKKKETKVPSEKKETAAEKRDKIVAELRREHEMEIREIKKDHELALKEKDFELRHLKDEQVKKLEGEMQKKDIRIAELEKENKMLDRIVDLNGDIVDVKNLVSKLIDKLPTIDLQSLTVNNGNTK